MALRIVLKRSVSSNICCDSVLRRCTHAFASPFNSLLDCSIEKPQSVLPENDSEDFKSGIANGIDLLSFGSGGSMELMAVPKKKTPPSKQRVRNALKELNPMPVIVKCKACGRAKLPYFNCCSGQRDKRETR